MSVKSGFFNSKNGDRKYDSADISTIFDGIINDGVFESYGDAFQVAAGAGMSVVVGIGRAWLDHTWTLNDAPLMLELDAAPTSGGRLDTVVLDVDRRKDVRNNSIYIVKGAELSNDISVPTNATELIQTDGRVQYPIAYIAVHNKVTSITTSDISYWVGKALAGKKTLKYVTGPLEVINSEAYLKQMEGEWTDFKTEKETEYQTSLNEATSNFQATLNRKLDEFNAWFADLKTILDSNTASQLTSRLLDIENKTDILPFKAAMHRNVFRGKDLGMSITDAQLSAIRDGTFNDLYVGDHWTLPRYENFADASDSDFASGQRLNNTGGTIAYTGGLVTGYIPAVSGDRIRTRFNKARISGHYYISFYDSSKTFIATIDSSSSMLTFNNDNKGYTCHINDSAVASTAYVRVAGYGDSEEFVVTKNETIVNIEWTIADINYWMDKGGSGSSPMEDNHLVVIPKLPLYDARMNSTDTTTGAYVGSEMYTTNLEKAKKIASQIFGSSLKTHKEALCNAVNNGLPSDYSYYDSSVELMSEIMVYGSNIISSSTYGNSIGLGLETLSTTQLALFRLDPSYISKSHGAYWLRDTVGNSFFAYVQSYGTASHLNASSSKGVRPTVCIG